MTNAIIVPFQGAKVLQYQKIELIGFNIQIAVTEIISIEEVP
jgi:hypothetical protein